MENRMTLREFICRNVWTFAVEEEYKEELKSFMEENGIKFKYDAFLFLPKAGWFYSYTIWSSGDIRPSRYAVESRLAFLREETAKKVED